MRFAAVEAIKIKRVYEKPTRTDGYRVLIDRLWPRGIKKTELPLHAWSKDLAPSNALRKAFGHDVRRWARFRSEYRKELHLAAAKREILLLAGLARKRPVTLLYSARDEEHNNAVVLQSIIQKVLSGKHAH